MHKFTDERTEEDVDQYGWLNTTLSSLKDKRGKGWACVNAGDIPVIQSDRGGQVTYHGPEVS